MSGPSLESELKYRAEDERPLLALSSATSLGPATLGRPRTADELDRYLDTADLRLAAVRWACRLRTRAGRTVVSLKGPAEHRSGAPMHQRRELEGPAAEALDPAAWPPSEARSLVLALAGGEPLAERLAMAQRRAERVVRLGRRRIGLLSLDRVSVLVHGAALGRLLVVELEMEPLALAAGLDPRPLTEALDAVTGLRRDPLTKLEHALVMGAAGRR